MNGRVDHLDVAYEALRAWCHERPDRDDPSTIYGALGSITRLLGPLAQIVGEIADTSSLATGSDDRRSVSTASTEIRALAAPAVSMLNDANATIARVHSVVAHLIFLPDEDG